MKIAIKRAQELTIAIVNGAFYVSRHVAISPFKRFDGSVVKDAEVNRFIAREELSFPVEEQDYMVDRKGTKLYRTKDVNFKSVSKV